MRYGTALNITSTTTTMTTFTRGMIKSRAFCDEIFNCILDSREGIVLEIRSSRQNCFSVWLSLNSSTYNSVLVIFPLYLRDSARLAFAVVASTPAELSTDHSMTHHWLLILPDWIVWHGPNESINANTNAVSNVPLRVQHTRIYYLANLELFLIFRRKN